MKKRMIGVMVVLSSVVLLTACGTEPKPDVLTDQKYEEPAEKQPTNQGITVNQLNYEVVTDMNMPKEVRNIVQGKREKRGFISYKAEDGLYIGVFAGEKSSGGYDINFLSVEDNEGKTNVYVEETAPSKDMITTQALTYPYAVIKVTGATNDVRVTIPTKNMNPEEFKKLN